MDESMAIVRDLLAGQTVHRSGGFYELDRVRLLPDLPTPVPVLVGGRSQAALRRAGRLSEGFLALWTTPTRWRESIAAVESAARDVGRADVPWRHGLQIWCGIADSAVKARPLVAEAVESLYRTPFEKFERYIPYGNPADIAAALKPFVQSGCRNVNFIPVAASPEEAIAAVAEVRGLLHSWDSANAFR
jgi:alkanesulfonate monooxygenase SsuD/methylene tetrahydromethanopterin reductase-like flavin-dependent oxidoreductase (luciferase family)